MVNTSWKAGEAMKNKVICVCDTCGKDMPKDEEKSNVNWTVYKNVCECGGKSTLKLSGK